MKNTLVQSPTFSIKLDRESRALHKNLQKHNKKLIH
jgi:hypothetical protein